MIMKNMFVKNAISERIESLKEEADRVCKNDREAYDIFYKTEIESLEKSLSEYENAVTVEESVSEDIFKDGEEVDEEFEMWQLGELNGDYKFGTQSWDI